MQSAGAELSRLRPTRPDGSHRRARHPQAPARRWRHDKDERVQITDPTLKQAQRIIGHKFADKDLLRLALTHASIADSRVRSNERLEFLGDAVLGMVVCDYLHETFTGLLEGDLTKIKSAAVSRRMCALIATDLGLDGLLLLGKGMKTRAALPSSLAAAVLESVIGAIYLDGGLKAVQKFLLPLLIPHINEAAESGHQQNFKSVLQQFAQRQLDLVPAYLLLDEKGPDHAKCFQVCVEINDQRFEPCWAASKKQAEQYAALAALESMGLIERGEDGAILYTGDRSLPGDDADSLAPAETSADD